MENFILILLCFALGLFFRRFKIFPANAPIALNRFIIYVSMPCLTLSKIYHLDLGGASLWVPVSMSWIVYLLGVSLFYSLGRGKYMAPKTVGALMLTGSLGNTSFVGFPLLEALYGAGALSVGILVDQPGTFLVSGTLGVATAAYYSGGSIHPKAIARKLLAFPPTIALLAAVPLRLVSIPPEAFHVLDRLADTLVPLALVSVGMQLHFKPAKIKAHLKPLLWGLGFKLILAPLLCLAIYVGLFQQRGEAVLITLIESAMAPMITAGILAAEYDLDTELATLMVGIGIPLSLLTIPVWAWILDFVRLG